MTILKMAGLLAAGIVASLIAAAGSLLAVCLVSLAVLGG